MRTLAAALSLALPMAALAADADEAIRLLVERETGFPGRVEVSVGAPNSRLQLAPCARAEPFVPAGARLWGRTTLGLRCVEGAAWQAFLPVQVKIFAAAPVAARALAQGETVSPSDLQQEEIEITRYPVGAIADPAQLADKQLSRSLAAGQPLLREYFRARPVLAQGDTVRLLYQGKNFTVSSQGRALSHARDGQGVTVVTESGKSVSGIARPGGVVELSN
ncbi:MAG TPA: flagellar basal body P-ring formation chaperone FlgA [Burkholderiales bacterium]|nr:flagellar basal body P-ring formation chaperone FlgA [Burkholderiales bacterium]